MIVIAVKHPVKPEFADGWLELVEPFTTATRAEDGNLSFDWYRSLEDPLVFLLIEIFKDAEAGRQHVESEHFQAAIAALPQWLSAVPEIVHIDTPGDGWSRMSELTIEA
jgi:quinol monooxygenase YgiN